MIAMDYCINPKCGEIIRYNVGVASVRCPYCDCSFLAVNFKGEKQKAEQAFKEGQKAQAALELSRKEQSALQRLLNESNRAWIENVRIQDAIHRKIEKINENTEQIQTGISGISENIRQIHKETAGIGAAAADVKAATEVICDETAGIKKTADAIETNTKVLMDQQQTMNQTMKSIQQKQAAQESKYTHKLKAAFISLEVEAFERAGEAFKEVLKEDPLEPMAHLGKLMAELHVARREDLAMCKNSFQDKYHYKMLMKLGSQEMKAELAGYVQEIERAAMKEQKRRQEEADIAAAAERVRELQEQRRKEIVKLLESRKQLYDERRKQLESKNKKKGSLSVAKTVAAAAAFLLMPGVAPLLVPTLFLNGIAFANKAGRDDYGVAPLIAVSGRNTILYRASSGGLNFTSQVNDYIASQWKNIICIAGDHRGVAGVKADGSVIAAGWKASRFIRQWKNVSALTMTAFGLVGIKGDGTVCMQDVDAYDRPGPKPGWEKILSWDAIVDVVTGLGCLVGQKVDGTLVSIGYENPYSGVSLEKWKVSNLSSGLHHILGLSNGKVSADGANTFGQCNVEKWEGIVAIAAGEDHSVGLKADGTVVAVGKNNVGQCNVSDWHNIIAIKASGDTTVGIRDDGSVVAVGSNKYGQCNVGGWNLLD